MIDPDSREEIRAVIATSIADCAPKWSTASVEAMTSHVMVGLLAHFGDIRIHRARAGGSVAMLREGMPLPAGPYRRLSSEWTRDLPPRVPGDPIDDEGRGA